VIGGSSILIFVLVMGVMFMMLYFAMSYSNEGPIPTARITHDDAIRIADHDLKLRLSDYRGIVAIIDPSKSRYVPVDEFRKNGMQLPLVYVSPNGTLMLVTDSGYENWGYCDSGLYAYCGWYAKYYFDYGSRLVYGVEVKIESEEGLSMYMVDATNGRIVDSTFLRSEWIRSHSTDES